MISSKLLRCGAVVALALMVVALSVAPGHAALASTGGFTISIGYGGCDSVRGSVSWSGVNIGTDPFGVEVDIVDLGTGYYTRWSGQAASSSPSGSESVALGWNETPPAASGTTFAVQVWVWDGVTGLYVANPSGTSNVWQENDYTCTTAAPPGGPIAGASYYLPAKYVMGLVTTTTSLYSQANIRSQVVGTLLAGQHWFIVGTAHQKSWYQIFVAGPQYAWVPANTMQPEGPVPVGNALYR
jgi:hypothetical protein